MFERSVDPIAFLENYHSSAPKIASSDNNRPDIVPVSDTIDNSAASDTNNGDDKDDDLELTVPVVTNKG